MIKEKKSKREKKEYERRVVDMEEEQSTADKALEKVDILYRMVNKMEGKMKKLESMVENMLRSRNAQMERIITLITEIKDEGKKKGKEIKESRQIVDYFSDDDEFY